MGFGCWASVGPRGTKRRRRYHLCGGPMLGQSHPNRCGSIASELRRASAEYSRIGFWHHCTTSCRDCRHDHRNRIIRFWRGVRDTDVRHHSTYPSTQEGGNAEARAIGNWLLGTGPDQWTPCCGNGTGRLTSSEIGTSKR